MDGDTGRINRIRHDVTDLPVRDTVTIFFSIIIYHEWTRQEPMRYMGVVQ